MTRCPYARMQMSPRQCANTGRLRHHSTVPSCRRVGNSKQQERSTNSLTLIVLQFFPYLCGYFVHRLLVGVACSTLCVRTAVGRRNENMRWAVTAELPPRSSLDDRARLLGRPHTLHRAPSRRRQRASSSGLPARVPNSPLGALRSRRPQLIALLGVVSYHIAPHRRADGRRRYEPRDVVVARV